MYTRLMMLILIVIPAISSATTAPLVDRFYIKFGPNGQYNGYLASPTGNGPFPALVVIHEWWGLNGNIRAQANKLAQAGYVALAVDLFGRSTTDMQEAKKMVQGLNQQAATQELLAATAFLRNQKFVRANDVGVIGWCFGGGQALNLAINDPELAAAVIYYGQPVTDPAQLARIKAPIIGFYGEADQSIPMAKVRQFDQALTEAKVPHEIHTYPGAGHAFANPTRSDVYRPAAAADAWEKTMAFLDKHLKR